MATVVSKLVSMIECDEPINVRQSPLSMWQEM